MYGNDILCDFENNGNKEEYYRLSEFKIILEDNNEIIINIDAICSGKLKVDTIGSEIGHRSPAIFILSQKKMAYFRICSKRTVLIREQTLSP